MTRQEPTISSRIQSAAVFVTAVVGACAALGGAVYGALDYFATKKEVNRLGCEADTNIAFMKAKQDASEYAKTIEGNKSEKRAFDGKKLSDAQKAVLSGLESYGKTIEDKLKRAEDRAEAAEQKLARQECSK